MRHLRKVYTDEISFDILAKSDHKWVLFICRDRRSQNITKGHNFTISIWNLNSNCRFSGNWTQNSNITTCYGIRNIFSKCCNSFHFNCVAQFNFITRDCWSAHETDYFGINIKLQKYFSQCFNDGFICFCFRFRSWCTSE